MRIQTKLLETDAAYWDDVAPDGATHYDPTEKGGYPSFMKLRDDQVFYWSAPHQKWIVHNPGGWTDKYIPRPQSPKAEWADRLPPVGRECEALFVHGASTRWRKCRVLMHGERECAVFVPEINRLGWCNTFRPIRTKEQQQREGLAGLLRDVLTAAGWEPDESDSEDLADAILSRYTLQPKEGES